MTELMKTLALTLAIARDALVIAALVVAFAVFGQIKSERDAAPTKDCTETARYYDRC
jgi:hypothetical protein